MNNLLQKNYPFLILIILVFITRFAFLSYPAEVVFDEVHFGKYVSAYFTHEYYFDIHPPLGKMLIAGFAKISGFSAGFDFNQIGENFDAKDLFILRFLPALLGSLIPLLIYLFLKKMGLSTKTTFLGAFMIIFDNALLTQSKFILLDIFLLFFGFSSLYFFLKSRKENTTKKSLLLFLTSIILATFSLSIKWTGLSFLGIITLVFLIDSFIKFFQFKFFQAEISLKAKLFNWVNFKEAIIKLFILILIPFIIYYLIFWLHFQILYKSGQGDAFMSSQFQKTLIGNKIQQNELPLSNWQKFIELNKSMYQYNVLIKATHPDSSKWYQWPIDQKPIWYWTKNENNKVANIYLFGNPVIWWTVLAGVIFSLFAVFLKKIRQKLPPVFFILLLGYFANILPYILIKRVAFLFHYLPSFILGILIISILYEKIFAPFLINKISKKYELLFYSGFLLLCFLVFIILLPLNYGFFIPSSGVLHDFYNNFIKFL